MKTVRKILLVIYLINAKYRQVGGTLRSFDWLEGVNGADQSYGPSLLTTTELSLVTCLTSCSNTYRCKAATYNNGTGECICLDRKTGMTSQLGNRLWNRQFHGFLYNAQLEWWIALFVNIKKTQVEAESFCNALEGRLAVVDTDEKLMYVIGLSDYQAERFFILGATDVETEGVFVWSNGANLTTNWLAQYGEPNGFRYENCVALYQTAFVDILCASEGNFACEIV